MDNTHDIDSAALDQILGDMDDMEAKRVYGDKPEDAVSGVKVVIDVEPKKGEDDHDEAQCLAKGGCVKHMAKGGMVDADDDMKMPPFLRKRK